MLKLTPQQVSEVAQLPDQTLRHWRKVLPPLVGLNGYAACFSPGDALALLVVRHLVKTMGISVATLAPASTDLFSLCRSTSWPLLTDRQLIVDVQSGSVRVLDRDANFITPLIVIPMRTFAEQLQSAWASSFPSDDQLSLQFPLSIDTSPARIANA
ncbi:MerR family transcriptional regulator [Paraburkholderia ferrariae]|uniref:helix-turn-helix domain-containing protein n=1 Tax=Paraburkholderia ferrariae TaxID=386056 RepID=UPI000489C810|nr:helix-turn-helix domain-containing protein [Paraburkholderia ferrariae]